MSETDEEDTDRGTLIRAAVLFFLSAGASYLSIRYANRSRRVEVVSG